MKRTGYNLKLLWVMLPVLGLLVSSCRDTGEEEREFERKLIQSYLAENNIDVEPTSSGLYYIEKEEGTGEMPASGDFVKVSYTMRMVQNEVLLSTTDSALAQEEDDYFVGRLYGPEYIQTGTVIEGLNEGLEMMKEGGRATLVVPSDLAWGASYYGAVPPYTPLIIEVELLEVIPDLEQRERDLLNQYLESMDVSPADSTSDGLYKIILEEGTGDTVQIFQEVTASFTGKLSDGRVFVEYDSVSWNLDQAETTILTPGFEMGIENMREGERAIIVVPYFLGYGDRTINYYDGKRKAPIPAYATLYYDVELLNVPQDTTTAR